LTISQVGSIHTLTPSGQSPISVGAVIPDSISADKELKEYYFTLSQNKTLLLDAQGNTSSSVNWTLVGPSGQLVSNRQLVNDTGQNVLQLGPATYFLTLSHSIGVVTPFSSN